MGEIPYLTKIKNKNWLASLAGIAQRLEQYSDKI